MSQWTKDDVKQWLQSSDDFCDFVEQFKGLSGKDLNKLNENQFLRRCPEKGDVIYYDVQKLKEGN